MCGASIRKAGNWGKGRGRGVCFWDALLRRLQGMVEGFCHLAVPLQVHMLCHDIMEVPAGGYVDLTGNRPEHFQGQTLAGLSSDDELPLGVPCLEGGDEGLAMQGMGLFLLNPPDAVC